MNPDSSEFWQYLNYLVDSSKIVIDRPKGSKHPRFPSFIYPVDYGYLEQTSSMDGSGIDIYQGSLKDKKVCGILCTIDLLKRDSEIKILLDCSGEEMSIIEQNSNLNDMRAILIKACV